MGPNAISSTAGFHYPKGLSCKHSVSSNTEWWLCPGSQICMNSLPSFYKQYVGQLKWSLRHDFLPIGVCVISIWVQILAQNLPTSFIHLGINFSAYKSLEPPFFFLYKSVTDIYIMNSASLSQDKNILGFQALPFQKIICIWKIFRCQ